MASQSLKAEGLPRLAPRALEEGALRRRGVLGSWTQGALLLDAMTLSAAIVASELGAGQAGLGQVWPLWLLGYVGLVLVLLQARGLYRFRLRISLLDDARAMLTATLLASMALLSLRVLVGGGLEHLAFQSLRLWVFASLYLFAGRIAFDRAQLQARRAGELARPTLIVGAGRVGARTARRLLAQPELGLRPVGFIDKEPLPGQELPLPVLGASWDLERLIAELGIEQVLVGFSTAPSDVLLREVRRCEELGVDVALVPRLYESLGERLSVEHLGGLPLLSSRRADPSGWQFALKYGLDRLAASILLALAAPLFALLALGTWRSLGRPIFFRQRRLGRDGREFEMLKLRTMRAPLEPREAADLPPDTAPGGVEGEDRRTRFGSFLRRSSLDELPQLLNVLRGEMSLVGPRPERPDYARRFAQDVYRYGDRQRVKSGITGWAQVHGLRGRSSLGDRVEWDNFYIEHWSLWLDLKILLLTLWAVRRYFARGEGAPAGGPA
jgi:exopolysaccharide biosynthesis polyprenyl glycosylphosphotransferase